LSTFFFAGNRSENINERAFLESGCQSQFQDADSDAACAPDPFVWEALDE
jgi:hypothetical protein